MKIVSTLALGLALVMTPLSAPLIAKEKPVEGGVKISPKVIPLAQEIQKAQTAKDWATVKAKTDEALPLIATPDDKLFLGSAYIGVGQNTNDNATLSKGVDLMLESGKAAPDQLGKLYMVQGQLAYQDKAYPKAETALIQARKNGVNDPNVVPILIESMRLQSKNAAALQTLNEAIAQQMQAGQAVPVEWFQRGFTIAYGAKAGTPDYDAVRQAGTELNKKWLTSAPTPAAWHDVLLLFTQGKSGDTDFMLDAHRLALAANGMVGAGEYQEYADSIYLRSPGEAKKVIDAGLAKKVYTLASNRSLNEINGIATGRLAADKASLPNSEKTAQTNPKVALAVGDGYYGYGNYAKAVDMYKLAGTKGVDADLVNIRVGTALAAAGDVAGAKAAFGQVKAGPRKDLADFWVVHLDHPTQG